MKKIFLLITAASLLFASCKKDEGKLPNIAFKTGGSYTSADAIVAKNTPVSIGITASKAEDKDVLTKFTITSSASSTPLYTQDLSGSDGDNFSHDYNFTTDSTTSVNIYNVPKNTG